LPNGLYSRPRSVETLNKLGANIKCIDTAEAALAGEEVEDEDGGEVAGDGSDVGRRAEGTTVARAPVHIDLAAG
jgi:hypothetical protein